MATITADVANDSGTAFHGTTGGPGFLSYAITQFNVPTQSSASASRSRCRTSTLNNNMAQGGSATDEGGIRRVFGEFM